MIPFSPPDIYQEIIDEVSDALNSGWITTGPRTKQLEKDISAYTGAPATLCLNSATSGLELVLRWFGVGPGDEIIVPAYTYCATANVVLHCGAKVVMADSGIDFNTDVNKIRSLITVKTKVIIPVDFAGLPCDYDEINSLVAEPEIAEKFVPDNQVQEKLGRILVLADAAHSFGARYRDKKAGILTDITVFSFHAVKNLTTAEGGCVCMNLPNFDNGEIYRYLCIKALHGQDKDALAKTKIGGWRYDVIEAGYKWNMTDIQAAMGLVALRNYDNRTLKRRREIFQIYDRALANLEWAELPIWNTEDKQSSCHLYPLRIKRISESQRDDIIRKVFEKEVSVNVHFPPLPMLRAYRDKGFRMEDYPFAFEFYSREISLPVYYRLTDEMAKQVIDAVVSSVDMVLNTK